MTTIDISAAIALENDRTLLAAIVTQQVALLYSAPQYHVPSPCDGWDVDVIQELYRNESQVPIIDECKTPVITPITDYTWRTFQDELNKFEVWAGERGVGNDAIQAWRHLKIKYGLAGRFPIRAAVMDAMAYALQRRRDGLDLLMLF